MADNYRGITMRPKGEASRLQSILTTIRLAGSLMLISAKMDLAWVLRDTRTAIIAMLSDLVSNVSSLSSIYLIAMRFGGIGGMSLTEVLFMLGYSSIVSGVFVLFGGGSNSIYISRIIGRGQLDHFVMQPVPIWLQLMTNGFIPFSGCGNLLLGLGVTTYALRQMGTPVTPIWLMIFVANAICTLGIIVARSYLLSTAAFYAPVAAEEITTTFIDGTWLLSTFPLSSAPAWLQTSLITILPEGLMAWFPSLALLSKTPLGLPALYPFMYFAALATITSLIFRKGWKHYVTIGSIRYLPHGFRR